MWLGAQSAGVGSASKDPRLEFLVAWVVGTLFILLTCAGLKRVRIDAKYIYISNYFREIQIPVGNISEVTENRILNMHPITIRFRDSNEFGKSIRFMPTRWFGFWSSHPVVAELKELSSAAKPDEMARPDA